MQELLSICILDVECHFNVQNPSSFLYLTLLIRQILYHYLAFYGFGTN